MRMTMGGKGTGGSCLIVWAVSPDKTIQIFEYRLFIVSISVLHHHCALCPSLEQSTVEGLLAMILLPVCWW